MAFLREFGLYVPERVVTNEEIGAQVGCDAAWIVNVSGIEERRFASVDETVVDLAVKAGEDCLQRAGVPPEDIGMVIVASGSAERRFPGPAVTVAQRLGLGERPALDLTMASAGSLFALSLAAQLTAHYKNVLVIGAERMSSVVLQPPMERGVSILFGDGAGACLVSATEGKAEVVDSEVYSDGSFAEDLKLEFGKPLEMNGRSVIMQASRKIPRAIAELLERNNCRPDQVGVFLMHQANQNLIARVAQALGVAEEKFYTNIRRFGNTSSASMLIAAAEWFRTHPFQPGEAVCFAAFGAGFHWGALLAQGV